MDNCLILSANVMCMDTTARVLIPRNTVDKRSRQF
jgi:hypothetical protein